MVRNPHIESSTEEDECTCEELIELEINRLLINGVTIQCCVCGGLYAEAGDEVLASFIDELGLPDRDEMFVRWDTGQSEDEHVDDEIQMA